MTGQTLPITGGCLCGANRYEASETPYWVGYCHCGMCKKAFGGPFGSYINFRKSGVTFTGNKPAVYQSSDTSERGFCARCGSPLFMGIRADSPEAHAKSGLTEGEFAGLTRGDFIALTHGSLDHPEDWPPQEHVYADHELHWLRLVDGLPRGTTGKGGPSEDT